MMRSGFGIAPRDAGAKTIGFRILSRSEAPIGVRPTGGLRLSKSCTCLGSLMFCIRWQGHQLKRLVKASAGELTLPLSSELKKRISIPLVSNKLAAKATSSQLSFISSSRLPACMDPESSTSLDSCKIKHAKSMLTAFRRRTGQCQRGRVGRDRGRKGQVGPTHWPVAQGIRSLQCVLQSVGGVLAGWEGKRTGDVSRRRNSRGGLRISELNMPPEATKSSR